ncbi:hypothetical protein [Candidatus Symbiopectobacterium sp.]|uniref:hypothetical protein n=1 Tax=Candidatus Symbiopectobacterium sp. TaxID=2816440 RepID=UPI0025C3F02A|nr:hypothetical protein [Candidatus Symbiopectobacterium sp.]
MLDLDCLPLHQSRFASIQIVCTPEMQVSIKDYFNDHGFEVHSPLCFSHNSSDKLSLMFELATQARKLAGAIMGLLNRNDIEIEISLCTALLNK